MSIHQTISPATQPSAKAAGHASVEQQQLNGMQKTSFSLPVQTRLTVGAVDDPLEHEADAMADTVMRMPNVSDTSTVSDTFSQNSFIQRKCAACEEEEKAQRKPLSASITPFIQTKTNGEGTTSASLSNKINSSRGSGSSMDEGTKTFMENRFGSDFSSVKIHTGSESVMMNRELSAKAFTVGNDIYFNEGQYNPQSDSGKHLLAHELTHTLQQGAAATTIHCAKNDDPPNLDYKQLAKQVYDAIYRPGTDEEAVYAALGQLNRDNKAIEKFKQVYFNEYKVPLLTDIDGDFSGTELEYALQLLNMGTPGSDQRIAPLSQKGTDEYTHDVHTAAVRIREAVETTWGTDEEAIYAALLPFKQQTLELQNEYMRLYNEDLRDRLIDELDEDELNYALSLLETPYEHYLQEANRLLAGAPFGEFGSISTFCMADESVSGHKMIYWYDKDFWEPDIDKVNLSCMVKLLPDKSASDAIDALFAHQEKWKIACAEFVQVNHLYALRHTMGKEKFDADYGSNGLTLSLKRRNSTGVVSSDLFSRQDKDSKMNSRASGALVDKSVDEILLTAPVGSRVRWTNAIGARDTGNPWQHENTIKMGPDKFAAHGTASGVFTKTNTHTRAEVELATARGTNPKADEQYVKANIFISEIETFEDPSKK